MSRKRSLRCGLTRREFLKLSSGVGAGAGAAWLLGACAPLPTAVPPAAAPAEVPVAVVETKDIIHATFNPNWANTVLNELADEKGWFAEEGIESQDLIIVEQTQIFPGLIGGSLMFAQQDTDAVAGANLAGEPIRLIAIYRDKEPWIFGVGPDIKTVEDLKGKQVSGGSAGGRNEFNGKEMLRRVGLDPENDVEWVPIGGGSDSRVNAVIEGLISGAVMFDRHRALIAEAGGQVIHDGLEEVPQDCYCVHESWLKDNERTVVAFLKATTQARLFWHDLSNKDEVISIMESRGYEFPEAFIAQYDRAVEINSPTGTFDVAAMDKLIADAVKTGSLETEIDWSG